MIVRDIHVATGTTPLQNQVYRFGIYRTVALISTRRRYLFVHIPKTAGESIERYLLAASGLSWDDREEFSILRNFDPARGPPRIAHLFASEYLQYGYLSDAEFGDFFKFAFVRNPWSRLVSEFFFNHYGY